MLILVLAILTVAGRWTVTRLNRHRAKEDRYVEILPMVFLPGIFFLQQNIFPRSVSAAGLFLAFAILPAASTAADKIRISYTSPARSMASSGSPTLAVCLKEITSVEVIYMPAISPRRRSWPAKFNSAK
jgi:hypothetical protein